MSTNLVLKKLAKLLAREIYSQVLKSCSNGHCTVSPNKKSKDWHLYIYFFFYSYIYIHVYISIYTISSQSFRWHYPNANPTNNFETTLGNLFDRQVFRFDPFFCPTKHSSEKWRTNKTLKPTWIHVFKRLFRFGLKMFGF